MTQLTKQKLLIEIEKILLIWEMVDKREDIGKIIARWEKRRETRQKHLV